MSMFLLTGVSFMRCVMKILCNNVCVYMCVRNFFVKKWFGLLTKQDLVSIKLCVLISSAAHSCTHNSVLDHMF